MKLFSLILTIGLLINSSQCLNNGNNKCFKLGEACKYSGDFGVSCGEHLACLPIDDDDESSEHICKEKLKLGEKCKQYNPIEVCESGLECHPTIIDDFSSNYTCIESGFAGEGENCYSDYNCVGFGILNLKCIDSKCKFEPTEKNQSIECSSFFTCPGLKKCNNSKCEPLSSLGDKCESDYDCFIGGTCSVEEKICVERYSKKLGESCLYESDTECEFGLKCDLETHFFKNGTFDYQESKCVPLVYSNTTNCIEDGCLVHEFCNGATNTCNSIKKYTNDCKEAEKERNLCYTSNNCMFSNEYYDHPFLNENSCLMKKCGMETLNYLNKCKNTFTFCD
ncbi:hypothetical protein RB653_000121 [Dictyostelium firmibasis]|uniref:Dickkopf N-terminal cysteine-rich domain-containing protein n=1 Tax=Dictyostelium firmibasis TaxID=79012 RepID=A0AAN7U5J9_9MYCE